MTTEHDRNDRRPREDRRGAGGRRGGPHRVARVETVTRLTEHLVRIVVSGELADWPVSGAGGHFKIFLPAGDEQVMRTYTVRDLDRSRGELTVDFAIHADGPATAFARSAVPGDVVEISGGSRPGFAPAQGSTWTALLADQSALPAVAAILEALPAGHRALVHVELPDLAEQLSLSSAADISVSWSAARGAPGDRLVDAAVALEPPAGPGEVWVGCEAAAMRTIRRHLLWERGLDPRTVHTRAYWKTGVVAHSDHDTGDEIEGAR